MKRPAWYNVMAKSDPKHKMLADNRRARYNYEIGDTVEAGIMLQGTEVKSLREGKANIQDSYASPEDGAIYLINAYIPEYRAANRFNHAARRRRKLLLHKREIAKLTQAVQIKGVTLVPTKLYFNEKGIVKVELGIGKGKKVHDKRRTEKDRDWERSKARLLREG